MSGERSVTHPNEDGVVSFSLNFEEKKCIFHLQDKRGFHRVLVGLDRWLEGETTLTGAKLHHGYEPAHLRVVARGNWVTSDCVEMILVYNETAFRDTITITFTDDYHIASLARSVNVNSFGTKRPIIHGVAIHEVDNIKKLRAISLTITYSTTTTTTVGELLDNPATRERNEQVHIQLQPRRSCRSVVCIARQSKRRKSGEWIGRTAVPLLLCLSTSVTTDHKILVLCRMEYPGTVG